MTTSAEVAPERHMRLCEACGGVDDDPRHVIATRPGDSAVTPANMLREAIAAGLGDAGVAEAVDNSTTVLHFACCAQRGCPDGTCNAILASAPKNAQSGAKLLAHIQSGAADGLGSATESDTVATDDNEGEVS